MGHIATVDPTRLDSDLAERLCRLSSWASLQENEAMLRRHLIPSLLAGVVLVSAGSLAQAACCPSPCPPPCPPPPCKTITRTITVMEKVPETYEVCRTCYKTVSAQETYTAYKTISVPETRQCTRTVHKCVPYWTEE